MLIILRHGPHIQSYSYYQDESPWRVYLNKDRSKPKQAIVDARGKWQRLSEFTDVESIVTI